MSAAADLIEQFSDVHPLPHVVTTVTRLIADNESTMKDFEDVIKMDPILVSRLLRLVNSPYYGVAQTINSISRAIAFLGMKNLHNLVVTDALKNIFNAPQADDSVFSKKRLWLHSAAVSISAKMVAERIFGINGDDAFLCGILHDFGLLVEDQVRHDELLAIFPNCQDTAQLLVMERNTLGTDHCEIGHQLTLDWKMPQIIQIAIRDHHLVSEEVEPQSLTGIIQISEFLSSRLGHLTLQNVATVVSPPILRHIEENADEYNVLAEDIPEEMNKAQAIYG